MRQNMEIEDDTDSFLPDCLKNILTNNSILWVENLKQIRNDIIGNRKNKNAYLKTQLLFRLHEFMTDNIVNHDVKVLSSVIIASLALDSLENCFILIENGTLEIMLEALHIENINVVEHSLRCLKYITNHPQSPNECFFKDSITLKHFITLLPKSDSIKQSVADILSNCCKKEQFQKKLCGAGIIQAFSVYITKSTEKVQLATLRLFSNLVYKNNDAAKLLSETLFFDESLKKIMCRLLSRENSTELQMIVAKCFTNMYRSGIFKTDENVILRKTLPTLIRMCHEDKTWEQRVEGAETLAYLIEIDTDLQKTAAITENVLKSLSQYFKYPGDKIDENLMPKQKDGIIVGNELRQAAFKAFAALAANDESIRKKIIDTETVMQHTVQGLNDPVDKVQIAAYRCMLSLSRSVNLLRTTFQDYSVWQPLMKSLKNASKELISVASSTLCNLLLEFSPDKETLINNGVIDILVDLTKKDELALRLNGIWGLMSMTYQADQDQKKVIIKSLGSKQLSNLMHDNIEVVMKTLGFLRNLLTYNHIDDIMDEYKEDIFDAVLVILNSDYGSDAKEQALCVLNNAADGRKSKDYIVHDEKIINTLLTYLMKTTDSVVQIASVCCLQNIIPNKIDSENEKQRIYKLRKLEFEDVLHKLLSSSNGDSQLYKQVTECLKKFEEVYVMKSADITR